MRRGVKWKRKQSGKEIELDANWAKTNLAGNFH